MRDAGLRAGRPRRRTDGGLWPAVVRADYWLMEMTCSASDAAVEPTEWKFAA